MHMSMYDSQISTPSPRPFHDICLYREMKKQSGCYNGVYLGDAYELRRRQWHTLDPVIVVIVTIIIVSCYAVAPAAAMALRAPRSD